MSEPRAVVTVEDFEKLDVRVVEVLPFPEGRYSTRVLWMDFGQSLGVKKSLAKLAPNSVPRLCNLHLVPGHDLRQFLDLFPCWQRGGRGPLGDRHAGLHLVQAGGVVGRTRPLG
jgi:hypothetical protein